LLKYRWGKKICRRDRAEERWEQNSIQISLDAYLVLGKGVAVRSQKPSDSTRGSSKGKKVEELEVPTTKGYRWEKQTDFSEKGKISGAGDLGKGDLCCS